MKRSNESLCLNPKFEESILQNPQWKQFDNLIHAFSSRNGGFGPDGSFSLGGPQEENAGYVEQNRQLFCRRLGIDRDALFLMKQVHGRRVIVAENNINPGLERKKVEADGVITQKKNLALAIQTADCLPILLYDPHKEVIGAVHAGWRSASLQIITETVYQMKTHFKTDPANCQAIIGPSIGPCCYEVGEEVVRHFPASARSRIQHESYRLDLWEIARMQLIQSGIKDEKIISTRFCTVHNNDLIFSYRVEGPQTGRMMALILMR